MDIKGVPKSVWVDLLLGRLSCPIQFLGFKILLTRLQAKAIKDQSPSVIDSCIADIINFFEKYDHLPNAKDDLRAILKTKGITL